MCSERRLNPVGIIAMFAFLAAAISPTAYALKSDSSQPIDITADYSESISADNDNNVTSVYKGHVIITQGSLIIHAEQATLYIKSGAIQKATARGRPATFQQQPEGGGKLIHGHAERIVYRADADTVKLIRKAKVTQGGRQVTAETIRYNLTSERVIANRDRQGQRRVHVIFPTKSSQKKNGTQGH
jgi:lipopolysaccharide export system protein LptA